MPNGLWWEALEPDIRRLLDVLRNSITWVEGEPHPSEVKALLAALENEVKARCKSDSRPGTRAHFIAGVLDGWRNEFRQTDSDAPGCDVVEAAAQRLCQEVGGDAEDLIARLGVKLCDLLIPHSLWTVVEVRSCLVSHLKAKGYGLVALTAAGYRRERVDAEVSP